MHELVHVRNCKPISSAWTLRKAVEAAVGGHNRGKSEQSIIHSISHSFNHSFIEQQHNETKTTTSTKKNAIETKKQNRKL